MIILETYKPTKVENNNAGKYSGYFSKKLRAGKRRTYFFDVRSTKQGDYFLTITESKKKFEGEGYDSHKIFLYKEDFKKFFEALNETMEYIKTELMPDYDYNAERPARVNTNHTDSETHSSTYSDDAVSHDAATTSDTATTTASTNTTGNTTTAAPQIGDDEEMDWK